jgi:hypothetical protein
MLPLLPMKRLLGAALALSTMLFAGAARAENMVLSYLVPSIGVELQYRGMGYNDAEGNFVDLAGHHILSSTVTLEFVPGFKADPSTIFMGMVVPVSGAASQYFTVSGSQLVETSPRHYSYTLTTDAFNGEIYSGRFSIETYALDALGNPVSLRGNVVAGSGFYYTLDVPALPVPEPASAALLLGGLAVVPALARRRRA